MRLTLIAVLMVAAAAAVSCGSGQPADSADATPTTPTASASTSDGSPTTTDAVPDPAADVSAPVPDPESAGEDSDVAATTTTTTTSTIPEPVVTALDAIEFPPITELGATGQASISATYSDGRIEHVLPTDAQWHTSDSTVVTVTDGIVTATGPGNATITAHYEQHQIAIAATVRISIADTATMRLLYAVPSDREFRDDYSEFFQHVVADVQGWYRNQLNGLTFSVYDFNPQRCQMTEDSEFYSRESWNRVLEGVQHCAPVEGNTTEHIWLLFVDVDPACAPDGTVGN